MSISNFNNFIIICDILENNNNAVELRLMQNNQLLFNSSCSQNSFCEKLPQMMEDILDFIKKNYTHNQNIDISNIEFITNFEVKKHLTTARVFEGFITGLMIV